MSKVLARLNPKLSDYQSSGIGGHGSLTPQDVAGALGYCRNDLASLLMRVKYAGHDSERRRLAILFRDHLEAAALKKGWRSKKELAYERLAVGAIVEYLDAHCQTCKGRRLVNRRIKNDAGALIRMEQACPRCNGTGEYTPILSERARVMEMAHNSYERTWQARWEFALSELNRFDAIGNSAVKAGLA